MTNTGGSESGKLAAATIGGSGAFSIQSDNCAGQTLAPHGSCTVIVMLSSSTTGMPTATLTVNASSGGTATLQLVGTVVTPGAISVTPSPAPLGEVVLPTGTADTTLMVTNSGGVQTGGISFTISGNDKADFTVTGGTCARDMKLAPNGSCTLAVHFAPTMGGSKMASLTVNATPGGPGVTTLTGTALTPATLAFTMATYSPPNPVNAGTSTLITMTLQNSGTQPSGNLPAFETLNHSEFTVVPGGSCAPGSPLAGSSSCSILVKFAPTSFGAKSDSLTLSAGPGGMPSANLSGTGQQAFTLTVATNGATASDHLSSSDGFISCGNGVNNCSHTYTVTTGPAPQPTITATTASNSRFVNFSGDCAGASCAPTMNADHINIVGNWQATWVASVAITGNGTVTSTSSPTQAKQFNCRASCSVTYDVGTAVTLTATPDGFGAVVGSSCNGASSCQLSSSGPSGAFTFADGESLGYWSFISSFTCGDTVGDSGAAFTSNINFTAAGVSSAGTIADAYACAGFPTGGLDASKYFTFGVAGQTNYYVYPKSVNFSLWGSEGQVSWAVRSSVDAFANNLASGTIPNSTSNSNGVFVQANVSAVGGEPSVYFRLYLYGVTGSPDYKGLRGQGDGGANLSVSGAVGPAP